MPATVPPPTSRHNADGHDPIGPVSRKDYQSVRRLAHVLTRNSHDAEDAVQDVLLRALRDQDKLRNTRAPRPWLHQMTRNCCHTLYRRRNGRPMQSLDAMAQLDGQAVADLVIAPEPTDGCWASDDPVVRQRLDQAIASLPPTLRRIFAMRFVQGLSSQEIRRQLGMPHSTLKLRLVQARSQLARALQAFAASHGVVEGTA